MPTKLQYLWHQLRSSYWFVPALMCLGVMVLAHATVRLDQRYQEQLVQHLGWLYNGGAQGARAVLSTIAGSMITVAGVVFSITIVALQLASSQFGPRVLSRFMSDTANRVVLGTFVSTFLYCLLVLRTVRVNDPGPLMVPHLSVTIGLLLALAGLGVLIFFIHHTAISIQAPMLVASLAEEVHAGIDHLFLSSVGEAAEKVEMHSLPPDFHRGARSVHSPHHGYVDAIDLSGLMETAVEHDLILRLECRPGDFIIRGAPLLMAWPGTRLSDELATRMADAFVLGAYRTSMQDVQFSLNHLVEMAVRALSTAINDPFTAMNCIDQIASALVHLAHRPVPNPHRVDAEGRLRLVTSRTLTYAEFTGLAFHQIRQNAGGHAVVYLRLLEAIAGVLVCVRGEEHAAPLLRHAAAIRDDALAALTAPGDRAAVEERYARVLCAHDSSPCAPPAES
ncbi:MAG TPA: DUF2254 domain-containing protein [Longimicrobiaceae bacterium]|nr:DUF2254 domain-containing protein [Longimicrobiaceae bacterium]